MAMGAARKPARVAPRTVKARYHEIGLLRFQKVAILPLEKSLQPGMIQKFSVENAMDPLDAFSPAELLNIGNVDRCTLRFLSAAIIKKRR